MGAMRDVVRIERRANLVTADPVEWSEGDQVGDFEFEGAQPGDGYGNTEADFVRIGPTKLTVEIREMLFGSGEQVLAEKVQAVQPCLVVMRNSRFARTIRAEDRFVELIPGGGERFLNVRTTPTTRPHDRYITFQCESGVAT